MKKALIITYDFPPVNNVASRRFGEMTKYMFEYGWEPWILTTISNGSIKIDIPEERVVRIGKHSQKSEKILLSSRGEKLPYFIRSFYKLIKSITTSVKSFDRYIFSWFLNILINRRSIDAIMKDIKIIVATSGPSTAYWIGYYFSKRYSLPFIIDFRDLGALKNEDKTFLGIMDQKAESIPVGSAVALTTVSCTLAQILEKEYKKRVVVVYNGWDNLVFDTINNHSVSRKYYRTKVLIPYIFYAGRFYQHQLNSLFLLMNALKAFENIKFVVRSLGPDVFEKFIVDEAINNNLTSRLFILPPADSSCINFEADHSLCNLVLEDISTIKNFSKGTLTGKIFDYMTRRPPILAIARPDSEIKQVLADTGKGELNYTTQGVIKFLKLLMANEGCYCTNLTGNITMYSRKKQAEVLCSLLTSITTESTNGQ